MKRSCLFLAFPVLCLGIVLLASGCTRHYVESKSQVEVAPVEVKPIHITIDINIRVDRALDDFFSDLDTAREEIYEKKVEPGRPAADNPNRQQR